MSDRFLYFICFILFLTQMENLGMAARRMECPTLEILNAKVRYKSRNRIARIRCGPGYMSIGGDRRLTCIRGQWSGRIPTCITPGCSDLTIDNGVTLSLYNGALVQFICNHGYFLDGGSSLYCNGEQWNDTMTPRCQIPPMSKDHLVCSFETQDICGWKQDHLDTHDWKWVMAGAASFIGTLGANADHTFGTTRGHYIMADSSMSWTEQDTAVLFSPIIAIPEETPACVVLWYYFYGSTEDPLLRVYVRPESEPFEVILPQLELNSCLVKDWQMAYVYLEESDDFFQIVLEAKGGVGHFNDICVDDFLVSSGLSCINLETQYEYLRRKNCGNPSNESTTQAIITTQVPPRTDSSSTSATTSATVASCRGMCGLNFVGKTSCQCDADCTAGGNCCLDYQKECGSTDTAPQTSPPTKSSSWAIPLSIVAGILVTAGLLLFWWQKRKKEGFLPEDSDIRKLEEDTKDDDMLPDLNDDNEHNTTSYRPLDNSNYPQEEEGTPV